MIYRFGDTSVDTLRDEIRRAGKSIPLRRKSFDVLVYLLERPRRVVTKTELLETVWNGRIVTEGSLKHCLMEVRSAIGDHDRELIRTVSRRGYILDAPVTRESLAADQRASILVAPIQNESLDSDDAYIADGLTEEIISELSKVRSLRVIARSSSMRLKGARNGMQDIAHRLGVDFILDGSIRKWNDELRIFLHLRHVDSEEAQWSEHYDVTLGDLFDIHDKIARSVADELAMQLGSNQTSKKNGALEHPRAMESYFRARYQTLKFSRDGLEQAETHLKNGLDLVGPNTRLLGALGHTYTMYSELGLDPTGEHIGKAAECVEKIFALDPYSSRGHLLLGMVQFHSGALRAAREPLERSLETDPADPDALMILGYLYALSGQNQQALKLFDSLLDVDPLTPINHCMPGFVAVIEGRYADALGDYRRFLEMDPQNPFAVWTWSYVLLRNNRIDEASDVVHALNTQHAGSVLAQVGNSLLHGVCGEPRAALDFVTDELRAAARNSELLSRELTHCLALAGETDDALIWLENTIRIGNVNYPFWSQHNQWVSSLRTSARFKALMTAMKQEWLSNGSHACFQ